jgi:hypothetical protein
MRPSTRSVHPVAPLTTRTAKDGCAAKIKLFTPGAAHESAARWTLVRPGSQRRRDRCSGRRLTVVEIMYPSYMNNNSGNRGHTSSEATASRWDFLTNHAHVLLCVARDPGIRLRDIAVAVGITERGAHKVLSELVDEGYVLRERHGRRNRYTVKPELPLRHPLVNDREVGDLLKVLLRPERPARHGGRTRSAAADRAIVR